MKPFLVIAGLLFFTQALQADDSAKDTEILAVRGKGVVTQDEFTARADRIPPKFRRETLRKQDRLQDVINTLLLRAQLAADAREAQFDQDPVVKARMQLAATAELAEAWTQHYVETYPKGDYEQLALEYYLLNKDKLVTSPMIDVSHILISTETRPDEEALQLVNSIFDQLVADPAKFDQLVLQYSEDPSAASNKGKFKNVKKGDMVKGFEDSAFSLETGEISQPVRSEYGYHIIRLDAFMEPEQIDFDGVKQQLIDAERTKHEKRVQQNYLESLSTIEVEMSNEALEELVRRLYGDGFIGPSTSGSD